MRVPVATGSIVDFVASTERAVSVDAVNEAFREAAGSDGLNGILGVTDEELVSSDIVGSPFSALIDLQFTMVFGDHMVKVLGWYDNEWGYALRVAEFAGFIAERIPARSRS